MTPLAILRYPDARLKVACAPVVAFDDDLRRLSSDLLQAMRTAPGVGITAAHVGIMKRVVVIELQPGETIRTLINPEIVWSSPQTARHLEGAGARGTDAVEVGCLFGHPGAVSGHPGRHDRARPGAAE